MVANSDIDRCNRANLLLVELLRLPGRDREPQMDERQLRSLERKIDELIELCDQLDRENRELKSDAQNWRAEREQLIEKTDTARAKVEAMIQRLRTLEKDS